MSIPTTCPRCGGPLRAPGFCSSAWQCERHGDVHPFHVAPVPALAALERLVADSRVPVWVPRPLPADWTVTGVGRAGDDRTGVVASLVAVSGPHPKGSGVADLVLVAEEPGIGLGAYFAGLDGTDPGDPGTRPPDAKLEAADHPTALWSVRTADDRAAFVAEARGMWLWAVLWPAGAGVLFLDDIALADAREFGRSAYELLGYGALSPRIAERLVRPD